MTKQEELDLAADMACIEYMKLDQEYYQLEERMRLLNRVLIPYARTKFTEAKIAQLQGKWDGSVESPESPVSE